MRKKNNNMNIDKTTYRSKSQNFRIRFIILHYTSSEKTRAINQLTNKNVSSHYLITDDENDPIFCLVDEEKRAWHAGKSGWKGFTDLNDISIGIELVNKGRIAEVDKVRFEPYSIIQIEKTAFLILDLIKRYNIEPQNILGHSDVAPQRKQDPGPLFPWEKLYRVYGIGMWCKFNIEEKNSNQHKEKNIFEIQEELQKFGYTLKINGKNDDL
ncbi:N-acetylmuramoyl-L-alanine amidase [Sebaldella sp. S0638]|uniref:N-acetylmuramoyl-L-alanine amidase n=1 Tax=Sebaldella sp. S0638 TaxID=2957809 RepID=UPI0020A1B99D|nr:N-acetylmuramoyl-L-alanine amidase [Sebaldella sp. S0638]MCP1226709.1 N-acetylmuramoyl-L-alanine amidase [Sebaldella sp. S0638]